jgi:endonuclease YncB( thermonuclease family)
MAWILRLAFSALLCWPVIAGAADLAGRASIIDGDTLEIHGQRIRLHGVDAPESRQTCEADGQTYRCGQQAALALADYIGQRTVACEERDVDRYNRIVAVCRAGGEDLNAWLVSQGLALAYRKYSVDYVDEEAAARTAQLGIWRGAFVPPWDWRAGRRSSTNVERGETLLAACCMICRKGKACGDSCISRKKTCHKPPGCACDAP